MSASFYAGEIRQPPPYPVGVQAAGRAWFMEWHLPAQDSNASHEAVVALEQAVWDPQQPFTTLAAVKDLLHAYPPLEPTLFIFHLSRCGSTLLARLLEADRTCRTFAEPAVLSEVYWPGYPDKHQQALEALPSVIGSLGYGAPSYQKHLVVKLTSPQMGLFLPLLKQCYPQAGCVLVHRNPVEIVVSNLQNASSFIVRPRWPNLSWETGIPIPELQRMDTVELTVHWIQAKLRAALKHKELFDLVIDYKALATGLQTLRERYFARTTEDAAYEERLEKTWAYNVKKPSHRFRPDTLTKRSAASRQVNDLCQRMLEPLYRELIRV